MPSQLEPKAYSPLGENEYEDINEVRTIKTQKTQPKNIH